ncbi:MAG: hypothetical protein K2X08_06600 [Chlamydiales bacterium]|nr:hypothetical protein [Chlamydiales bacterium]
MSVLHPELVGWGIVSFCRGQPALTKTYGDWLKNTSEEQKNGSLITNTQSLKEFSFGAIDPTFSRLDEALKTLKLTYIDPQANKGYGILPVSEEGWKVLTKESEQNVQQKELAKEPEQVVQAPEVVDPTFNGILPVSEEGWKVFAKEPEQVVQAPAATEPSFLDLNAC